MTSWKESQWLFLAGMVSELRLGCAQPGSMTELLSLKETWTSVIPFSHTYEPEKKALPSAAFSTLEQN